MFLQTTFTSLITFNCLFCMVYEHSTRVKIVYIQKHILYNHWCLHIDLTFWFPLKQSIVFRGLNIQLFLPGDSGYILKQIQ